MADHEDDTSTPKGPTLDDGRDPEAWYTDLETYIRTEHERPPLPDGHMLDALGTWQRRITGGALLSFLEWATSEEAFERYPLLAKDPLTERIFVCITDLIGAVAYHEIVDRHSDKTICVLKDEWRAFLEEPSLDHDDTFTCHYEFWSVWHQEVDATWEIPEEARGQQLWVHEEGFAVADESGRGSQHLWGWDGDEMNLLTQDVTKWVH